MSIKDFPKKCLGCKKEGIPLNDFEYMRRKGKKNLLTGEISYKTTKVTFPACDTCEKNFENAMKAGNRARKNMVRIIPLIIALAVVIYLNFFGRVFLFLTNFIPFPISDLFLGIIIIAILAIVIVIMVIQIIIGKNNPYKISNFIIFNKDSTFTIIDPEYAKEVKEKVQERIEEEVKEELFGIDEENAIYCPKCGNQAKKGTDFCKKCGKDLRVAQ